MPQKWLPDAQTTIASEFEMNYIFKENRQRFRLIFDHESDGPLYGRAYPSLSRIVHMRLELTAEVVDKALYLIVCKSL